MSWSPVLSTLAVSVAQCILFVLLFEGLRRKKVLSSIFCSRVLARPGECPGNWEAQPFGWVASAFRPTNTELQTNLGLDTYMFLRFLRIGFLFSVFAAFLCLSVLLPVYLTGEDTDLTSGFEKPTIASVKQASKRLWAPLFVFYCLVGFICWLLVEEWKHFASLRAAVKRGDLKTHIPTTSPCLLVENIPPELRSQTQLSQLLHSTLPDSCKPITTNVCLNTPALQKLSTQRMQAVLALEQCEVIKTTKPSKVQTVRVGAKAKCIGGQKVDAVEHWTTRLEELKQKEIAEFNRLVEAVVNANQPQSSAADDVQPSVVRAKMPGAPEEMSSTAIVLFNSIPSKFAALQHLTSDSSALPEQIQNLDILNGPHEQDVMWGNVWVKYPSMQRKRFFFSLLLCFGVMFWAIPVSFVQAIANLDTVSDKIGIWAPNKSSVAYGLISGYLPVIALVVLMIVVPILIQAIATNVVKFKSATEIDHYTLFWHFCFQVANLWLVLIGGSLFNQFESILDKPEDSVKTIAKAVPGASQFFLNLAITQCFSGLFLELSQIVNVIVSRIMAKIKPDKSKSQRQLDMEKQPPFLKWGWIYPPMLLNLFVVFTYATMTPVIPLFAAFYFGLAWLVFRHQTMFVYAPLVDGGGIIWLTVFKMIMGCLYMSEIIVIAYFSVKEAKAQAPLSFLAFLLTIGTHIFIYLRFVSQLDDSPPPQDMEVPEAGPVAEYNKMTKEQWVEYFNQHSFVQPCLQSGKWEVDPRPYRAQPSA